MAETKTAEERDDIEHTLPDAEDMARQLARAPADKRALVTAISQAVLIGATIAEQCSAEESA